MLKISIYAVGKPKEAWIESGIEEYAKRLKSKLQLRFLFFRDDGALCSAIRNETAVIALDPGGELMDSPKFSHFLEEFLVENKSRMSFVIGGAEGLPKEIRDKCPLISLSKMTFTHGMARLLLVEQIYRALEIIEGSPYHK